ncbi:DegT/DnrJ/EryC1/StrS family aminotransferase [Metallumcola ferriviriculae]|uniref:DegT/DnrJ/EryC1/StrS family aminotransferase n=2 Tax=Metallumcola ferriviriculae TaxID=3039180 RepID=A0AAU0UTK5_9FIRM|nr:DegT/DnrJ/EryC1/StrS family aminotransferase [Desulfitibacteraceae bacterium MK1]
MINVTKTYLPNVEKYKHYVDRIFASGWVTNNGQVMQELEQRLKDYLQVENLVLVSNGTLALQVAYKLLGITGDVITTPFSFVATTSSLVWEGLNPIFVDIHPQTLNLDWTKLEDAITEETSCILPVHVFGNGCHVKKIHNIASKYGLKVIYDAAHAFGVKFKDKSIFDFGDISVLSFHATKAFHSIEGGALIFNDNKLYEKAKLMINFGIDGPDMITELGINAKMNEFQAAMGLCVLDDIDEITKKRKSVYKYYLEALSEIHSLQIPQPNKLFTSNYNYFPIIFSSERELLKIKMLFEQDNIYPRRYFYPSLEKLPYIKGSGNVPIADDISRRILCLPLFATLTRPEQDKIISILVGNLSTDAF